VHICAPTSTARPRPGPPSAKGPSRAPSHPAHDVLVRPLRRQLAARSHRACATAAAPMPTKRSRAPHARERRRYAPGGTEATAHAWHCLAKVKSRGKRKGNEGSISLFSNLNRFRLWVAGFGLGVAGYHALRGASALPLPDSGTQRVGRGRCCNRDAVSVRKPRRPFLPASRL
jgi:hypothetical protein